MTRTCSDCPKEITPHSVQGRCRSCALRELNRDPAFQARRRARLRQVEQEPDFRERHAAGCRRGAAARMADPVKQAALREHGRTIGALNAWRMQAPEVRAAAGAAIRAKHLSWCPPELWDYNQVLKRAGYRLPDRKAMIADHIAAEAAKADARERARLDAMTPFERDMAKIAAGARVVDVVPLRKADHAFTLGGVATGML